LSDFSPSSALDVVETKIAIGQIVLALKVIKTDFSSKLFTTIVCCSQHVELLTNSVSARHGANCPIFGFFVYSAVDVVETKRDIGQIVSTLKIIKTVRLSGLFTTGFCCLEHVEILTNFVSARHRAKCSIFGFFAEFVNRRRQNEKWYQVNFLRLKVIRIVFFEQIIYHDCLLFTTRRNMDEHCICRSFGEMSDFRPFRQVQRST